MFSKNKLDIGFNRPIKHWIHTHARTHTHTHKDESTNKIVIIVGGNQVAEDPEKVEETLRDMEQMLDTAKTTTPNRRAARGPDFEI